jgi:hypothetical protein
MKRLFGRKNKKENPQERITDSLIGTGEHMCTCAALVADMIVDAGQAHISVKDALAALPEEKGLPCDPPAVAISAPANLSKGMFE